MNNVITRWSRRSLLAILDQGLFSGSNFIVNILLARWLTPEAYGAFAIAFSLYLLLAGLIGALTLEPMLVYGAAAYADNRRDYLWKVNGMHVLLSSVMAAVFFGLSLTAKASVRETFLSASIALPFMLHVWFVRRAFYAASQGTKAAIASAVYGTLLIAGFVVLKAANLVAPGTIYAVLAIASLGSSLCALLTVGGKPLPATTQLPLAPVVKRHWAYGKWLLWASLASSVSGLLYAPLLGMLAALTDAAAFKAIQNLVLPFYQLLASLSLLLLPAMARQVQAQPAAKIRTMVYRMTGLFALMALGYGGSMALLGKPMLNLLYSKTFYADYFWLIPAFALTLALVAARQSLAIAMRALEKTRVILYAKSLSAGITLLLAAATIPSMKLHGVVICMITAAALELLVLTIGFVHHERKRTA